MAELARLDPTAVTALQINNIAETAWDNLLEETALGRLPPGQGHSNSLGVIRALVSAGVDAPLNVEVFSAELMALPPATAATRLADSMRQLLVQL